MSPYGALLAYYRTDRGYSQQELARLAYISRQRLCAVERGRLRPLSDAELARVATALSLSEGETKQLKETEVYSSRRVALPDNLSPRQMRLAHVVARWVGHLDTDDARLIERVVESAANRAESPEEASL